MTTIDRHPHSQAFHDQVDDLRRLYEHHENKAFFDAHGIHDLIEVWGEVSVMCHDKDITSIKMVETLRYLALVSLATIQGISGNTIGIIELLDAMRNAHDRKQKDYGTSAEPFENVLASRHLGINPIVGILIRMNDKATRLKSFLDKGNLENENAEDSMLDISVYAIITVVLINEVWRLLKHGADRMPDWWID